MTPGEHYATKDESTIGRVDPDQPLKFSTNVGLSTPGVVASFRVYVVLTTANERGSNTVQIRNEGFG